MSDLAHAPVAEALEPGRRGIGEGALVIDFHVDTLSTLLDGKPEARSLARPRPEGHVDLERIARGGVTAYVFVLFTADREAPQALERTLRQIDLAHRLVAESEGRLALATTAAEVREARAKGRTAILFSIENGAAIRGSLELLRTMYRLGVRAMGLVWNGRNEIGDGVGEEAAHGHLTSTGRLVVKEMQRLGMLVDVSHLNREGFHDVMGLAERPVIASHSNAKALCGHRRNLDDEQLKALAATGGVVGANFYPPFLRDQGPASLEDVVRHIDHLARVMGPEHVGIGSDYDGIETAPAGLEDCSRYPVLAEALLARGFQEAEVRGILGENWLRVIERVLG